MIARLSDIPVKVMDGATGTVSGGLIAILWEITEMLKRLAQYDEPAAIDMRSLPFSSNDYQRLR
ncbi:MAG TPA: hypothetical protein VNI53_02605 [Gammaproteobacteria bacterium]|nr:hypothetical protein [Gammaproteobacteria bacterium]